MFKTNNVEKDMVGTVNNDVTKNFTMKQLLLPIISANKRRENDVLPKIPTPRSVNDKSITKKYVAFLRSWDDFQ